MPTPVTDPDLLAQLNAPDRASVAASPRVWGDKEAEASGLYEPSGKQVTNPNLLRFLNGGNAGVEQAPSGRPRITVTPLRERMVDPQAPADGGEALQRGLNQRAADLTTGQRVSPVAQQDIAFSNVLPAATQGTDPNVDRYQGKLISKDLFQSDSGEILYRDPATGNVQPTDTKTQVAIRDPADGQVKLFSRSDATDESGAVGAARVLAPGLASGAVTARPGIALPSLKSATPRASDIVSTAKPFYQAFRDEAGQIYVTAEMRQDFANRLRDALGKVNLTEEMAGPAARSAIKMLEGEAPMSLDEIQRVKRMAGRGFNSSEKDARDAAASISGEIGRIIGEVSKPAAQSLKTGDQIFATGKAVQDLQQRGNIAELKTGSAGYGGNAVNNMRSQLRQILEKAEKGKSTGFQPGELQAMREIVDGSVLTNGLRLVGQMSPSKGIIQTGVGISTGGATAAVGAAANKLATMLTAKQLERLNQLVAKRSPAYEQAVSKAVDRFTKAQEEFVSNPTPAKMGAYISASRALSNGLTKDGIAVTSGSLLRMIEGPAKSAADEEQPAVPGRPGERKN